MHDQEALDNHEQNPEAHVLTGLDAKLICGRLMWRRHKNDLLDIQYPFSRSYLLLETDYQRPVPWRCINCGFIYVGKEAPKNCPACAHPQGYFERIAENW